MPSQNNLNSILIRGHRQEMLLQEAVIVNPDEISGFVDAFSDATKPLEGKTWFKKKLRNYLMNTPALLVLVNKQNSQYPEWANTAIAKGEPAYEFNYHTNQNLIAQETKFQHIADWFNAMAHTLSQKPKNEIETHDNVITKREFSKIMHYDPEMAYTKANEWFKLMGNRLIGTKEGVDVVYTWTDGYYAVRYTDLNTMKLDGRDLQNCLQNGNYWNAIQDGSNSVYGIRKPNNEAVVGIRVKNGAHPTIIECKGKSNEPVTAAYRSYVVEFLNFLQAAASDNYDLKSADIHYNNGKYGTFVDTAQMIYDKSGMKIYKGDSRILVQFGKNNEMEVRFTSGSIVDVVASERMPVKVMISALNVIAMPPAMKVFDKLQDQGIVYNQGYEPLEGAGTVIASFDGYNVISLGYRYLLLHNGKVTYQADKEGQRIVNVVNKSASDADFPLVFKFLNAVGAPPNDKVEMFIAQTMQGTYDGVRYGSIDDLCEVIEEANYAELYQIGDLHRWIVADHNTMHVPAYVILGMNNSKRLTVNGLNKNTGDDAKYLIRSLISKNKMASVSADDAIALNVMNIPVSMGKGKDTKATSTVVTNIDEMFAQMRSIAKLQTDGATGIADPNQEGEPEEVPFVHIKPAFVPFLQDQYADDLDEEQEAEFEKIAAKFLLPKQRVLFKPIRIRPVYDINVKEYQIMFPMAGIEIYLTMQAPVPKTLATALIIGVTQATKMVTANKNDLFHLDKTAIIKGVPIIKKAQSAIDSSAHAINQLTLAISKHNANLEAMLKDKLKTASSDTSLGNRFAAMNVMRMLNKDKK